jgi:hypothetical protein
MASAFTAAALLLLFHLQLLAPPSTAQPGEPSIPMLVSKDSAFVHGRAAAAATTFFLRIHSYLL